MENTEIISMLGTMKKRGHDVNVIDGRYEKEYYLNGKYLDTIFKNGVTQVQKERHNRIYH